MDDCIVGPDKFFIIINISYKIMIICHPPILLNNVKKT